MAIPNQEGAPPAREVFRAFERSDETLTVIGSPAALDELGWPTEIVPRYDTDRGLPPHLRARRLRGRPARVLPTDDEHIDLQGRALALVGSADGHPLIAALMSSGAPLSSTAGGFAFGEREYRDTATVLNLRMPSPWDPNRLLHLVVGNDAREAARQFARPLERLDFELVREGERVRFGRFVDGDWRRGIEWEHDLDAELELRDRAPGYELWVHRRLDPSISTLGLLEQRAAATAALRRFLDADAAAEPPIRVTLYPSMEEKALHTGRSGLTDFDPRTASLALAAEGELTRHDWHREADVWIRGQLGEPRHRALAVGLGVHFAPDWWGAGARVWARRLADAGQLWSLAELIDEERWEWASEPTLEALAGSFVAFLIEEKWSPEVFRQRFAEWTPDPAELAALERDWQAWVRRLPAVPPPTRRSRSDFQRGINLTNEAFDIEGGFLSATVDASLERAAEIGVDSVAIVAYARYPSESEPLPIGFFRSPRKESDGGILHAALEARRRGMRVLIKPQLEGPWPGFIRMGSEEDWETFFREYERFLTHYAMLAELAGAEMFSIGVELVEATRGHDARWRAIAERVRALFGGRLIYAANWGEEFERIGFWDAVDYIGLDSYYPIAESGDVGDAQLAAGARQVVERIHRVQRRHGKPLLLAEVGFSGSASPWRQPWQDDRSSSPDPEGQARAYRALIAALEGGRTSGWLAGTYWWKWSTDLRIGGGPEDFSHRFHRKAAADVLGGWYRR